MYTEIALFAKELGAYTEPYAPMSRYTSFKTGGNASLLIVPQNIDSVGKLIGFCKNKGIKPFILGNGSNVLVTDGGIDTVVIKLGLPLSDIELIDETTVRCSAGTQLKAVCMFALEHSLSGLEFAYGIPGTLGGAVYMNAGAYGGEMKDVVVSCTHFDEEGKLGTLCGDKLNLGYRRSAYSDNGFTVISADLKLRKGDPAEIKAAMDDKMRRRKEKQPLEFPSAGSTFKRPEGYFAGALIEDCGLKGYSVGGAQVSEKHAGFVINRGGASSSDILQLIKHIQDTVYEKHGVLLEPEVKIIGS